MTNLRARFRDLYTQGDDTLDQSPTVLRKYFYSVIEWVVDGHCYCNGHAESCVRRDGESTQLGKVCTHFQHESIHSTRQIRTVIVDRVRS